MPWKLKTHLQLLRRRLRTPAAPKDDDGFYRLARWRRFRRIILSAKPLCVDPFGHHKQDGVAVLATDVDHIIPRAKRPDLAFVRSNCQPLCKSCHSRKTGREQKARRHRLGKDRAADAR